MSQRDALPNPIETLIRTVAGRQDDDDQRASTFARGLALGALVGAAIAGSTIWQRRHSSARLTTGSKAQETDTPSE
jgi:hypothetical protein